MYFDGYQTGSATRTVIVEDKTAPEMSEVSITPDFVGT